MLHALTRGFACVSRLWFAASCGVAIALSNVCTATAAALQTGSALFDQDLASVQNVSLPWDMPLAILTHDLILKVAVAVAVIGLIIMGWEMTHRQEDTSGHMRRIGGYCVVAAVLLFGVSFIRGLGLTGNGALIHF